MKTPQETQILIVDDDEAIRFSLVQFLEDEEYMVSSAANAQEAVKMTRSNPIDLAIVDIRLPGKNGEDLIIELHQECPDIHFIIYTGSCNYELREDLQSIGIATVLHKPVSDLTMISRAISTLLQG